VGTRRTRGAAHRLTDEEQYPVVARVAQTAHPGPGRSAERAASAEDAIRRRRRPERAAEDVAGRVEYGLGRAACSECGLERLDVVGATTPPCRRYLLFAGQHPPAGGLGELVGVFEEEVAARAAFATLRLRSKSGAAWGELGAVDAPGQCAVLCWFGHGRPVPRLGQPSETPSDSVDSPTARLLFWRRWERSARRRMTAPLNEASP
jgi:hypothetical protein